MIPRNRTIDRSSALFVLGLALFFPPILLVFNIPERVFGIPTLYLYVFTAWAGIIALARLLARGMSFDPPSNATGQAQEPSGEIGRDA